MWNGVQKLDRILRGEATRISALRKHQIAVPPSMAVVLAILAAITGACMGCFALFKPGGPSLEQLYASTLKVPLLFTLTLLVTFPSLYVFNALVGSRLRLIPLVQLLVASLGVTISVLASFGPIVAFFSVSTTSYPFMVLLNVLLFALAGLLGLTFLLQTLHRLSLIDEEPEVRSDPPVSVIDSPAEEGTPLTSTVPEACQVLLAARPRGSTRQDGRATPRLACEDRLPDLDRCVRIGGCPNELGVATVYRKSRPAFHIFPSARFELFRIGLADNSAVVLRKLGQSVVSQSVSRVRLRLRNSPERNPRFPQRSNQRVAPVAGQPGSRSDKI